MKEKIEKKYLYWGITIFSAFAALIILFFIIYRFKNIAGYLNAIINIVMPFIFGFAIAYIINPIVNFFETKVYTKLLSKFKNKKLERVLSLATAAIIFIGCIFLLFSLLVPNVIESIQMLANNIDEYLDNSKTFISSYFKSERIHDAIDFFYNNMSTTVTKWFSAENMENLFSIIKNSFLESIKFIYNFCIGFVIAIYILNDKEKFKCQIKKILYAIFNKDTVNFILENIKSTDKIFINFFNAKLIDSLIIGVICFIGMLIFKMPYALMISVIVGVTNIIPYFGPFIGAIPSALIILLVNPQKFIWFVIFIFILQQFDGNVLGPKILGDKTGLSSFWVLFSLLLFGKLFGIVGMIIGVPIFSIIYTYINNQLKKRLTKKELPVNSSDYKDINL